MNKQVKLNLFRFSLIFFLFLFSLTLVSTAPPQEPNPDGLSIQFSEIDTIKQSTDHQFNFHVINATQVLTNETTTCDFDMFSPNGDKLFDSILDFRNANEFYVDVDGGNFSELGQHSYITSCNTSLQAGFIAFSFDVTPSGQGGTDNIVFYVLIITFIVGLNLIAFFGKNIPLTILTGMSAMFLGVYLITNGIIIFRDELTNYISYVIVGIGTITSFWAILEQLEIL